MKLLKGDTGNNKKVINGICKQFNIDILFGNYPYLSWMYPNGSSGSGKWWDIDVDSYTILMPTEVVDDACVFSLFHEIGHIIDHRMGTIFNTSFSVEVSAWRKGYELLHLFNITFDREAFRQHVASRLETYNKLNTINVLGCIRDNIINNK